MTTMTETPEAKTASDAPPANAELTRHDIFKYAEYVHVGDGAQECPHATDGRCQDEWHFHAWCRLPNPFQVRDISDKAKAAQARKVRALKDPESDSHVVLEAELDIISNEESKPLLVDEIVDREFMQDYDEALKIVRDMDDPEFVPESDEDEVPKLYANIQQDQEEYDRQSNLPEDQREDDFPELEKTVSGFSEAVNAELAKIQEPKKERLRQREVSELVNIIRRERIEAEATEAYLYTYNSWQWFVCTFKPAPKGTPTERCFKDYTQFKYETPSDVVTALKTTFAHLESRLAGDRGNS